ncbi:hypothetical protein [Corynebacterium liangguodongii]|uniref:Uncharacterized protein n=1 Tax=Corynebacterium liangguodongii TaxID=2079535 RepID=A0A2S0WBG0_9CORY|nr:hypothetical protein [Corynebacterium liangguodongii]AWB83095.1 hypothetical protein C3E79_00145 [Corynebacterium liangguodongii]PWB99304.1 hypothetical protein DF219_06930 [Corynebacterium liangguodongii]
MNQISRASSYVLLALAAVLLFTGQFPLAALAAFIGVWGLKESHKAPKADDLDRGKPAPSADVVRRLREDNPGMSLHDAVARSQAQE